VHHARPTTAMQQSSSSTGVPVREERPSVITNTHQPMTTKTGVIDYHTRNVTDPRASVLPNDVVDELDDDLDAAMMDVDLDMFNDNSVADIKDEGVPDAPMEMSSDRTPSLKTINDIKTIIKDKFFHGTLRIKVCMYKMCCFVLSN